MKPGNVFYVPATRAILVAQPRGRTMKELYGVCGAIGVDWVERPHCEELGNPGVLGPGGWIALYQGVRRAKDYEGRCEAVRTAAERGKELGG